MGEYLWSGYTELYSIINDTSTFRNSHAVYYSWNELSGEIRMICSFYMICCKCKESRSKNGGDAKRRSHTVLAIVSSAGFTHSSGVLTDTSLLKHLCVLIGAEQS